MKDSNDSSQQGHQQLSQPLTKISANNAVPGWVVLFVKLLLDESRNVLLDVEFFKSLRYVQDGPSVTLSILTCETTDALGL